MTRPVFVVNLDLFWCYTGTMKNTNVIETGKVITVEGDAVLRERANLASTPTGTLLRGHRAKVMGIAVTSGDLWLDLRRVDNLTMRGWLRLALSADTVVSVKRVEIVSAKP